MPAFASVITCPSPLPRPSLQPYGKDTVMTYSEPTWVMQVVSHLKVLTSSQLQGLLSVLVHNHRS